jgi:DNA-binding NarL/FixJ family response regulator
VREGIGFDFELKGAIMAEDLLLKDKKILIVDDERDVLDSLEQLLPMCEVVKASTFDEGKARLESEHFDIAILDIMGVDGYGLLEIANSRKVMAVMLTAHALTPGNIVKSYERGAASYLPKEEMAGIAEFLEEILDAKAKGKSFWWRWLDRWGSYYDKKFGADWQEEHKEFWDQFRKYPF